MTKAVPFPTLRSVADHEVLWWCLIVALPPSVTLRHQVGLTSGRAHELHTGWESSGRMHVRPRFPVRGQLEDMWEDIQGAAAIDRLLANALRRAAAVQSRACMAAGGPVLGRRAQVRGHRLARCHDGELLQGLLVTWRQRGGKDVVVGGAGAQAVHVRAGAVGGRRRHRPHHKALALQRESVHIRPPRAPATCRGCKRPYDLREAADTSSWTLMQCAGCDTQDSVNAGLLTTLMEKQFCACVGTVGLV